MNPKMFITFARQCIHYRPLASTIAWKQFLNCEKYHTSNRNTHQIRQNGMPHHMMSDRSIFLWHFDFLFPFFSFSFLFCFLFFFLRRVGVLRLTLLQLDVKHGIFLGYMYNYEILYYGLCVTICMKLSYYQQAGSYLAY